MAGIAIRDFLHYRIHRLEWVLIALQLFTVIASGVISWRLYSLYLVHLLLPIFTTVAFMATLIYLLYFFSLRYRKTRVAAFQAQETLIQRISQSYLAVTHQELLQATANFSHQNIIGKGRFGTVYRGILGNGHTVAIKRMELQDPYALNHFLTELEILGRLRHRNLLRILGYFVNSEEMIIVSKFMANLSLDVLLHGPLNYRLDWRQRLNIAVGVGHGLSYLHHDCRRAIMHCDLKPGNILVDEDMEPHIADFGVAKTVNSKQLTETSSTPRFTVGYSAPERAYQFRASPKSDVYSYGIVLLELITGRRPTCSSLVSNGMTLPQWAKNYSLVHNNLVDLIDDCLQCNCTDNSDQFYGEVELVRKIGIICAHENPEMRPRIEDVVLKLVEIKEGSDFRELDTPITVLVEQEPSPMSEITRDSSMSSTF